MPIASEIISTCRDQLQSLPTHWRMEAQLFDHSLVTLRDPTILSHAHASGDVSLIIVIRTLTCRQAGKVG